MKFYFSPQKTKKNILKKLSFSFILCFFILTNTFSQTETCKQIGNGSSQNNNFPFASKLDHSYIQQIYTYEDLNAQELEYGDQITGISFNYFWETPTTRPIKIFIGNALETDLSSGWIPSNSLKEVFSSDCQEFSKGVDNWTKISFTETLKYTGKSIVIAVLMNKEQAGEQTDCFNQINDSPRFFTHNVSDGITRYVRIGLTNTILFDDATGYPKVHGEILKGKTSEIRNNLIFCKIPPSCPKVTAIKSTDATDNSITLSWTNGNTETSWEIEYGLAGFIQGEGTIHKTNDNPNTINNLNANREYDFFIRADCSEEDKSIWTKRKTFKTTCQTINSLNYIEEFTDNDIDLNCWTIIDANEDGDESGNSRWSFSSNHAKYIYDEENNADDWLISPKIKITEGMKLTFDYKASEFPEEFSVWAISGDSPNDYLTNASPLQAKMSIENQTFITNTPISLQNYHNQTIYIGIKCESEAEKDTLHIDNFRVYKPSSEKNITSLTLLTQTEGAKINNENQKINIEVSFSTDRTALAPIIEVSEYASIEPASGVIRDFTSPQEYIVTSEDEESITWTVEVKNAENKSNENNIIKISFPLQEDEDNVEINKVDGIVKTKIDWLAPLNKIKPIIEISKFATINPPSGEAQDFSSGAVIYTVTSESGEEKTWQVTIEKGNPPKGATCENPIILNLSDLPDTHLISEETTKGFGNTFSDTDLDIYDDSQDKVYKINVAQSSVYTFVMESTTSYTSIGLFKGCPSDNILLEKNASVSSGEKSLDNVPLQPNVDYFLMIDNSTPPYHIESYDLKIIKNEDTQCLSPMDLGVSEVLNTSAIVKWSKALEETEWELKYGKKGFEPEEENGGILIVENITSPYNLTGLEQQTEYSIYIRSKCTESKVSEWKGPKIFVTEATCKAPTDLSIASITTNSADITWEGYNAANWVLEYKLSYESDYEPINTNTNTYTLSNLNPSSAYNVRVKAKCEGDEESAYSIEKTFLTPCVNISNLPYIEDFQSYGVDNNEAFSHCWHRPVTYSGYLAKFPSIVPKAIGIPSRCLKFQSEPETPTFAVTPIIQSEIKNIVLSFKLKREHLDSGSIIVGLMDDPNNIETFSEIKTFSPDNNNPTEYILTFSEHEASGEGKSIAFKHSSNTKNRFFWIDDVKIRKKHSKNDIISFITPDLLSEVSITYDNHKIKGTISYMTNIEQQTPEITISEFATISPESGKVTNFSSPVIYTVEAEDGSPQDWEVTITKATSASSLKEIKSFSFLGQKGESEIISENNETGIVNAVLDWEKSLEEIIPNIEISNFASISPEGGTTQNFKTPVEYSITAEDGSTKVWKVTIVMADSPVGSRCENPEILNLSTFSNNPHTITGETTKGFGNMYSNTDLGDYDNGQDKIYKLNVSENSLYNISLNTTTDYVAMGLFNGCPSENILIKSKTSGYNDYQLDLNDIVLSTDGEYFLMVDKSNDYNFIESYNLTFTKNENPPCISPNSLKASNILQNSAEITWLQALNEDKWELQYGVLGYSPDGGSGNILTENIKSPYTLTGLNPNTNYSIYIRSKCPNNDITEWYGPISFETLVSCKKPSDISINSSTANSAEISWNGHDATSWVLEYRLSHLDNYETKNVSSIPFILSELNSSSSYTIRIKSRCANSDESEYSDEISFQTSCQEISNLPYFEDFENYGSEDSEAFPICWTRPETYNGFYAMYPSIVDPVPDMPTKSLKFQALAGKSTIATTSIFNDNIEDLVMEFKIKRSSEYAGSFTIGIMTDPNDLSSFSEIKTITPTDDSTVEHLVKFSDYSIIGANKRIAFKHKSESEFDSYFLDDLKVRKKYSEKEILYVNSENMLNPGTINTQDHSVTGVISFSSDISQQSPTIKISNFASISPESGTTQNFSTGVTYKVTAEDGSWQDWTVTLTKATTPSTEKEILGLTFLGQVGEAAIDSENAIVNAVAKWDTNLETIIPTIKISNFASISPEGGTTQNFSTSVTYKVTAEDESHQDWTVNITLEESPCLIGFQTPFKETFLENSPSINCWTIIDNNKDGNEDGDGKWMIFSEEGIAGYGKHEENKADDWLISPKISISNGAKLNFKYASSGATLPEMFSVYIIKNSPYDLENAILLIPTTTAINTEWQDINFPIPDNIGQEIYIGIKCESEANKHNFDIKDFSVSKEGAPQQFTLTASVEGGNGTITPTQETVTAGSNFEFTIKAAEGYVLEYLKDNGQPKTSSVTSDNKYKLNNINEKHTIVVKFKKYVAPTTYKLTTEVVGGNGNISPSSAEVAANGSYTFTITPNNGYVLDELIDDKEPKTNAVVGNKYTLTGVNKDHHIVLKFKEEVKTYKLSTSVFGGNGSISPISQTVNAGSDFEFTITPAQGYILDNLKDNNINKTDNVEDNKYKVTNIKEDHTIVVKFKLENSISEESILDIKIYPNPTNDLLNIEVTDEISDIEILTINGKSIHKQRVNDNKFQYQTSVLAEGNYLIKIYTNNKIITKQFSVKR